MTSEADLHEGLRAVAHRLDAVGPIDLDAAVGRRGPAGSPSARPLLAAVAVVALLVAVLALVVSDDEDEGVRVDQPPATATTEAPDDPDPTTTPAPGPPASGPVVPPSYDGIPWEQLPARGRAVVERDRVTLVDDAGVELGSFRPGEVPLLGSVEAARLLIRPGLGVEVASDIVEEGGCLVTGANGTRVGACGPEQGELVLLDPSGARTQLVGTPFGGGATDAVGRWRRGQVSPDGRWVLAQWSGECEVPTAFLVPTGGGGVRTADGFSDWGGELSPGPATSATVGWTADGRAVVAFEGAPGCGSGDEQPGTYLIDPATLQRTPADVGGEHGWIPWERVEGNDLERVWSRATEELGLEACCGEPAHGGAGLTGGVVWQGREVPVGAVPLDGAPSAPLVGATAVDLDGVTVGVGQLQDDSSDALAFTCGGALWILGGDGTWVNVRPILEDLARALVPRLYCTAGAPPGLAGG